MWILQWMSIVSVLQLPLLSVAFCCRTECMVGLCRTTRSRRWTCRPELTYLKTEFCTSAWWSASEQSSLLPTNCTFYHLRMLWVATFGICCVYGLRACNAPGFICWFQRCVNRLLADLFTLRRHLVDGIDALLSVLAIFIIITIKKDKFSML